MPQITLSEQNLDAWFAAVDPLIRRLADLADTVEHNRTTMTDANTVQFVEAVNNEFLVALDDVLTALTEAKARLMLEATATAQD